MMTIDAKSCSAMWFVALVMVLVLSFAVITSVRCDAQATWFGATNVAALHNPADGGTDGVTNESGAKAESAPAPADRDISPAVAKQLAAMQAEIEALKTELRSRDANASVPAATPAPSAPAGTPETKAAGAPAVISSVDTAQAQAGTPEKPKPTEPFAYADWTWLNGNARNKDIVWDSKFFTPEFRMDAHYIMDLNHPKDDTMGGSTEIFRSNEFQIEQISFGGNLHWQNVQARILSMGECSESPLRATMPAPHAVNGTFAGLISIFRKRMRAITST